MPLLRLARARQEIRSAELWKPIGDETLRGKPLDTEFRRLFAQRILGGDIGESAALVGNHVVDAVRTQAGRQEAVDITVAEHRQVVSRLELVDAPVFGVGAGLLGVFLEVMARDDQES